MDGLYGGAFDKPRPSKGLNNFCAKSYLQSPFSSSKASQETRPKTQQSQLLSQRRSQVRRPIQPPAASVAAVASTNESRQAIRTPSFMQMTSFHAGKTAQENTVGPQDTLSGAAALDDTAQDPSARGLTEENIEASSCRYRFMTHQN